ncbi:MAG: hypothetical protein IJ713_01250 [Oscillibacter sp.]|nr:hypothetical protein [Oscillibacter sp.]
MKKVTYEFEVPDFCPEACEAFNPVRYRDEWKCLHEDQCKALHRVIQANAELDRILEEAGVDGERAADRRPYEETEAGA